MKGWQGSHYLSQFRWADFCSASVGFDISGKFFWLCWRHLSGANFQIDTNGNKVFMPILTRNSLKGQLNQACADLQSLWKLAWLVSLAVPSFPVFQKTFYISFDPSGVLWAFRLFKKIVDGCRLYEVNRLFVRSVSLRAALIHLS